MSTDSDCGERGAVIEGRMTPEAIAGHVARCASCRSELAWIQTERAWMAQRQAAEAPLDPAIWAGIARRIGRPQRGFDAPWLWRLGATTAIAVMAIGLMYGVQHHVFHRNTRPVPVAHRAKEPTGAATLDAAEREYVQAIAVLERSWAMTRQHLSDDVIGRYDAALALMRADLERARLLGVNDWMARLHVLDIYADYMQLLQKLISAEAK